MEDQYFTSTKRILENGPQFDTDLSGDQSTLQYYEVNDESAINENYMTAIGDNETKCMSMNETFEITVGDLQHLALIENEDIHGVLPFASDTSPGKSADSAPLEEVVVNQGEADAYICDSNVVVFMPKNSNKLYGIQLGRDEHGNIQKYQFQFRTNEDGELEVMEETLSLLSNAVTVPETQKVYATCEVPEHTNITNAKIEVTAEEEEEEEDRFVENFSLLKSKILQNDDIILDNKSGLTVIEETVVATVNIKEEPYLSNDIEYVNPDFNNLEERPVENERIQIESANAGEGNFQSEGPAETIFKKEHNIYEENDIVKAPSDSFMETQQGEPNHNYLVQQLYKNSQIEIQYENELDSSRDTYSQNATEEENVNINEIHEEIDLDIVPRPKCESEDYEIETVTCNTGSRILRDSNIPKSKSNFLKQNSQVEPDAVQKPISEELPDWEIFQKRFAKNRDAMQAKNFHLFLNRTTISYAPVRHQRQPRKQEINPVRERKDEEIIVQEVVVSSNGFVEGLKINKEKYVKITATVELSDSEEETRSNENTKQSGTALFNTNFSVSDINIIEIYSDGESVESIGKRPQLVSTPAKDKTDNSSVPLKRRRGRPSKKTRTPKTSSDTNSLLPKSNGLVKKFHWDAELNTRQKGEGATNNAYADRSSEINCPHCPKTFPSQNSLNTHIIHHNLENSLKNKARMATSDRKSILPKFDYAHKCEQCGDTFKNSILLKRHNCPDRRTLFSCAVCLKSFRDITLLNIHKKCHAKSNLVKNTRVSNVTPKKLNTGKGNNIAAPKQSLKCPRVCDSEKKLTSHKKFVCCSCSLNFTSKLLLDTHVRTNCVKLKAPTNKRLSFGVRKSFIRTPPRHSLVKGTYKNQNGNLNQSGFSSVKHNCDKCSMKFSTFRTLYTHKVQMHGLSTPDKSLMDKPKAACYRPKAAHSGIPANDKLKKAFAALREKLCETKNLAVD